MKLMKDILLNLVILFFVSCTAWPALIPIPPGKTTTTTIPIPLVAAALSTPALRITAPNASNVQIVVSSYGMQFGTSAQLGAIDTAGNAVTSAISSWTSSNTTIATVNTTNGSVSADPATAGTTTITATHPSLGTATLSISVNATGTPSILAFDGKNFIQLSGSNQNISEEK